MRVYREATVPLWDSGFSPEDEVGFSCSLPNCLFAILRLLIKSLTKEKKISKNIDNDLGRGAGENVSDSLRVKI